MLKKKRSERVWCTLLSLENNFLVMFIVLLLIDQQFPINENLEENISLKLKKITHVRFNNKDTRNFFFLLLNFSKKEVIHNKAFLSST